jgi:hypothetical protein
MCTLFKALLTTNVPVIYMARYVTVRNDFEAGNIHYEGHWKVWALEIEAFLGPEIATSEASAIWAQNSRGDKNAQKNRKRLINFIF